MKEEEIILEDENITGDDLLKDAMAAAEQLEVKNDDSSEEESPDIKELSKPTNDSDLLKKLADSETQFRRLSADFENFRRRKQQEREQLLKYGIESFVNDLLPALDNFSLAISSSKNATDIKSVLSGVEMIQKQMFDVLKSNGVNKIDVIDKVFDPNLHEAVQQVENSEKPDQTILNEVRSGYQLFERIIRPSMVVISKKVEEVEDNSKAENENDVNEEQDSSPES